MATPVQIQYQNLKSQHPDALLFFQLGEFYELFYEDAQVGSRILGLTLTARHRGTESEMPMCGMPMKAAKEYLEQLVNAGYRVAVADQCEDEDGKITRKISRVLSPGATIESGNLDPEQSAYLVAIQVSPPPNSENLKKTPQYALAVTDLTTGEFRTTLFDDEVSFFDELYKLAPREILLSTELFACESFCSKLPKALQSPRPNVNPKKSAEILRTHFGVQSLDGFGIEKLDLLIQVSAMVLGFLQETQKSTLHHVRSLKKYSVRDTMVLDQQTCQHLEIFHSLSGERDATLLSVFEKSGTALGARQLRRWLAHPSLDADEINQRLEAVSEISNKYALQESFCDSFASIYDLERLLSRLVLGRGNARDLVFLRMSMEVFPALEKATESFSAQKIRGKSHLFKGFSSFCDLLAKSLVDAPPIEITTGGMIRDGYDARLDELRVLKNSADNWLKNFLEQKKKESGIEKLKLKYSKTFGFCLEAPTAAAKLAPTDWVRRQTLVNAERFSTPELAEYEQKFLSAETEAFSREHELFLQLREQALQQVAPLQKAAQAIAELDVYVTFARTARAWNWTRPEISETNRAFSVKQGRHPVVEKISAEKFIANDLLMHEETSRFHLITGPNMAGKSTFLRQNALIILLAQCGSFVPAKSVEMSVFDRVFTRVGASDNLAAGKSTFFVEMAEAAKILHTATERSFVILDEIGRGTSTFDGISLAWAISEYLHTVIKAKTLFATHYHEMIECVELLDGGQNFHVSAAQTEKQLIFLRKILPGGMSDSFGIEVAVAAGIPRAVIERSRSVLERLETMADENPQPSLFDLSDIPAKTASSKKSAEISETEKLLRAVDPNDLTPKAALEFLYELKAAEKN